MSRFKQSKAYSPNSEKAAAHSPGRKIFSSDSVGWRSVLLQTYEQRGSVEQYDNVPTEDHLLLFYMGGEKRMDTRFSRNWRSSVSRAGVSAAVAPGVEKRSRWNVTSSSGVQMMKLFIPGSFFAEAREKYRRAGLQTCESFLLSETDLSVGEIALACGYVHQGHFADAFRRQFASSPTHLRMIGFHTSTVEN